MGAVLIVILKTPSALFLLFMALLIVFGLLRPPLRAVRTSAVLMFTALSFTMITQGFFYYFEPRTPILTLLSKDSGLLGNLTGGIALYREGILYGAVQSLRLFSAMLLSSVIVMTTYPYDLLLGLEYLGVPERIGFMVTVSIRFLPALLEEAGRILTAQRLRGLNVKGVRGGFLALRHLLPPLVINSLRNARRISLAAEVRAFSGKRTRVRELRFTWRDWMVLGLAGTSVVFLVLFQGGIP